MKTNLLFITLSLLFSNALFATPSPIWFSDQPPDKSMLKDMRRRHGGYVRVVDGIDQKQLWLRRGDELHKSTYLDSANGKYAFLNVQQLLAEPFIGKQDNSSIRFAMPDEGYYNVYYTERSVNDNILDVTTAKAEVLKHNCRNGHKYDRSLVNPQNWIDAPLDIVRLRQPEEDFHSRLRSGTNVQFKILHRGKPAEGARVKLETKRGWIKSVQSDGQGIASFQIIQDNFFDPKMARPKAKKIDWKTVAVDSSKTPHATEKKTSPAKQQKLERGHNGRIRVNDSYLVTAEYLTDVEGILNNLTYQQTQFTVSTTGRYYPQQLASKSSSQGLLFTSAGILVMGVGGYTYRKRRVKPFKEEKFDEH